MLLVLPPVTLPPVIVPSVLPPAICPVVVLTGFCVLDWLIRGFNSGLIVTSDALDAEDVPLKLLVVWALSADEGFVVSPKFGVLIEHDEVPGGHSGGVCAAATSDCRDAKITPASSCARYFPLDTLDSFLSQILLKRKNTFQTTNIKLYKV